MVFQLNYAFYQILLEPYAKYIPELENLFLIHLEEHVVHSAKSLFDQCYTLANLASENNIEIFDGWDAGSMSMT